MSGICGVIRTDGGAADPAVPGDMAAAAAYRGPDGIRVRSEGAMAMAYLSLQLKPEDARDDQPALSGDVWLVADARIDNLEELAPLLDNELAGAPPTTSAVLHAAFRRWGVSCPQRLVGDYAFVVWDARRRQIFAARDPSGVRSLHYRLERSRFLFATEIKQILAAPGVPRALFEPAVAGYLAGGYERPEWTFYEGIRQLAPGQALEAWDGGSRVWSFWDPAPDRPIRYLRESSYAEHFRGLLEEAVRCRIDSPRPVGVLLSGGVDSGVVTSVAAHLRRMDGSLAPELRTYSFAFTELAASDERRVSDRIVARFGLPSTAVPGDDAWPLSGYPTDGPDVDSPFIWVYRRLIHRGVEQAARDGVGVLLTGEGGDELLGDEIFDLLGLALNLRLPTLRREAGALARERDIQTRDVLRRRVLRPLRRSVSRFPGLEALGPRPGKTSLPHPGSWVDEGLARRTDLTELVRESPKHAWDRLSPLERRRLRLTSGHLPRLLAWQERLHAKAGVGAAMPLADQRLVRFVLAIPQWVVNAPSERKRLARRAVRGVMPEDARRTARKAIPIDLYRRGMNERGVDVLRDLIGAREMSRRGYVDPTSLAEQLDQHLRGGSSAYDLWWAATLEWWLRLYWSDP